MQEHICREATECTCSPGALEPGDDCPLHGHPWPPRCVICGRFMPWPAEMRVGRKDYQPCEECNYAELLREMGELDG